MSVELYVDGELIFEDDDGIEYDENGDAWWFDEDEEIWYFFDTVEAEWIEWYDDEEYDYEDED